MNKHDELNLRRQEVVDECDITMEEETGIGLTDAGVRAVEYAFMQGFHAAGELVVRPMQEVAEYEKPERKQVGEMHIPSAECQVTIEEIAHVALGMVFDEIGDELDLSDEELLRVRDYLEAKLEKDDE